MGGGIDVFMKVCCWCQTLISTFFATHYFIPEYASLCSKQLLTGRVSQSMPSAPTCVDQLLSCLEEEDQDTQTHQRILEDLQVMAPTPPIDE